MTDYLYNHFLIKRFIFVWSFFIVYRIIKTITNHSWLLLMLEAVTMPPPWLILHFFFVSCFIVPGRSRRHGHLMSPWTELCLCLSWRPTTNFHPHPPSHLRWPSTGKELCCNCYSKPTESCSIVCDVVVPSRGRCLDSWLSWFFKNVLIMSNLMSLLFSLL